uniref:ZSWIM1/3 RNaseH-like domain-containing protein n=1 Tax=Astatotilapia calliptera TaxID=8154 RepID=A0AAX7VUA0_ASTCA
MMRKKHFNCGDSQCVHTLLNGKHQEHVLFYQPYTSDQELMIVLQTPVMKSNMENYAKQLVFVDTTHCVNQYSFPLFTLVVRDDHGHGVPVAYAIVSNESQKTLETVLGIVCEHFPTSPRAFMVDKDFAEINALQKVFPESAILLCWYHVLQAVNRWLSKSESGVHGLSNTQKRNEIISFFCKLKACTVTVGRPFPDDPACVYVFCMCVCFSLPGPRGCLRKCAPWERCVLVTVVIGSPSSLLPAHLQLIT